MDTGVAIQEANWRTDAHYNGQYGLQNVVQEVNRATLQDLANRGGLSLPTDVKSCNLSATARLVGRLRAARSGEPHSEP